jgi:hypothetical protein
MAHKRGKRQRYEQARLLKRGEAIPENTEPCPECGALPGDDHKDWCAADEFDDDFEDGDDDGDQDDDTD